MIWRQTSGKYDYWISGRGVLNVHLSVQLLHTLVISYSLLMCFYLLKYHYEGKSEKLPLNISCGFYSNMQYFSMLHCNFIAHSTQCTLPSTICNTHYAQDRFYCTTHIAQYAMCTMQCKLCNAHYTKFSR